MTMLNRKPYASEAPAELEGDARLLANRLGSPGDWAMLAQGHGAIPWDQAGTLPALRDFLFNYRARLLVSREWPAIFQAHGHARRQETRELIALDQQFALEPGWEAFATASQRLGQMHLRRLQPLRDQRLIRRYWHAVQKGEARGWHTLVYGIILAVYHLPLRQGLISYARQTLNGFIHSAAKPLQLADRDSSELMRALCDGLPEAMEALLAAQLISKQDRG